MLAIALFSGGLDSLLAIRIMQDFGITVRALHCHHVFNNRQLANHPSPDITRMATQVGVPLDVIDVSQDIINVVNTPQFGYGKNINPCMDCHLCFIRHAHRVMQQYDAQFIITGDVLNERPKSQRKRAMATIDAHSGINGYIVRPLSAKLLPPSIPEQHGWINRDRLLAINGKRRAPQLELAQKYGLADHLTPAGGCLLTDPLFCKRLCDLKNHHIAISVPGVTLLKYGRYIRISPTCQFVISRNQYETEHIHLIAQPGDLVMDIVNAKGPMALARGIWNDTDITTMAQLLAGYSKLTTNDAHFHIQLTQDTHQWTMTIPIDTARPGRAHLNFHKPNK